MEIETEERLRSRGITPTRQRTAIMEALLGREGHVSAEQLHAALRRRHARIGLATVYRTLLLLRDKGVVAERDFGGGSRRYERERDRHHDHLVCLSCSRVIEFEVSEIERLQARAALRHGFHPVSHRLEIYGTCAACRAAGKGARK